MWENEQKLEPWKRSSRATLMKTESFGCGALFMKRRSPELCHFCDGSAALK